VVRARWRAFVCLHVLSSKNGIELALRYCVSVGQHFELLEHFSNHLIHLRLRWRRVTCARAKVIAFEYKRHVFV